MLHTDMTTSQGIRGR